MMTASSTNNNKDPDSPNVESLETLIQKGLDAYSLGDDTLAIKCWERALKIEPNNKTVQDYIEHAIGNADASSYDLEEPGRSNTFSGNTSIDEFRKKTSFSEQEDTESLTAIGHGLTGYASSEDDHHEYDVEVGDELSEEELVQQILQGSTATNQLKPAHLKSDSKSMRVSRATIHTFSPRVGSEERDYVGMNRIDPVVSTRGKDNISNSTRVDNELAQFLGEDGPSSSPSAESQFPKRVSMESLPGDEAVMQRATEMYESGSYETAYFLCQEAQKLVHRHEEAIRLQTKVESKLSGIYYRQIGDLEAIPQLKVQHGDILWADLDHKAGFVISLIDGNLSFSEILDVCAMPSFDALRIFAQLKHLDVI